MIRIWMWCLLALTIFPLPCLAGYTDNGDGTVTDSTTGLIWQKNGKSSALTNWTNALSYCEALSLGGKDDWRLPDLNELKSLLDFSKSNPCIDNVFGSDNTYTSSYWTSTTESSAIYAAYKVIFSTAQYWTQGKGTSSYIRCVRGGPAASADATAVLSGAPSGVVVSNNATVTVSGTGVASYMYKMDSGSFSAATAVATAISLTNLADGAHTLEVLGLNSAGKLQANPTTATWTVDSSGAPTAVLSGAPSGATAATTATITVSGTDVAKYRYKLDSGDYGADTAVATAISLSGLGDGEHTVSVKAIKANGLVQANPTTATWTVDTAGVAAVLSGAPSGATTATTASITVSGTDVAQYRYKLDSGSYGSDTAVATAISLSGLGDGEHTVYVLGIKSNGIVQSTPTNATWTVDTSGVTAVLTGAPTGATSSTNASITVSGTGVAQYRYKLDSGSYGSDTAVATPITLTGLENGEHTVSVLGIKANGIVQSVATTATWTVDTSVLTATLAGAPEGVTGNPNATVTVSGTDVSKYRYKMDSGDYGADTSIVSPIRLSELSDGAHTLYVKGIKANGIVQSSPTTASWTVDTSALTAVLAGAPSGVTASDNASITVSGTDVAQYRYKLDNGTYGNDTAVATPITLAGLADGDHNLYVLGIKSNGLVQSDPTTAGWTVDTEAVVAALSGAPSGTTTDTTATVTVSGTNVATYRHKLDSGDYGSSTAVSTPISLTGLSVGMHTLYVLGAKSNGIVQIDPTTASWTVKKTDTGGADGTDPTANSTNATAVDTNMTFPEYDEVTYNASAATEMERLGVTAGNYTLQSYTDWQANLTDATTVTYLKSGSSDDIATGINLLAGNNTVDKVLTGLINATCQTMSLGYCLFVRNTPDLGGTYTLERMRYAKIMGDKVYLMPMSATEFSSAVTEDIHVYMRDSNGNVVTDSFNGTATVYAWIKDNGAYDVNSTVNVVADPGTVVTLAGASSSSSSNSGGCALNPAAELGVEWLLLAVGPVLGLVWRRRR